MSCIRIHPLKLFQILLLQFGLLTCWKVNLLPSFKNLADWCKFSSLTALYMALSSVLFILTSFWLPDVETQPQNIMLPLPLHCRNDFIRLISSVGFPPNLLCDIAKKLVPSYNKLFSHHIFAESYICNNDRHLVLWSICIIVVLWTTFAFWAVDLSVPFRATLGMLVASLTNAYPDFSWTASSRQRCGCAILFPRFCQCERGL